jgi:predicted MFS family arabinose efflux permease
VLLAITLLALVIPFTFGRQAGWPAWVWGSWFVCALSGCAFVLAERRTAGSGEKALLDLSLFDEPGVRAGVSVVLIVMACYSGILVSLTLYLQGVMGFSPLHAGLVFAVYAVGFALASLSWTRTSEAVRGHLPVVGPIVMGAALLAVGLGSGGGAWPAVPMAMLLFSAGVGHACGFAPLANRLTARVAATNAADMSGIILTAGLIGNVLGVAVFSGIFLSEHTAQTSRPLAFTTAAIAASLLVAAICARASLSGARQRREAAGAGALTQLDS